MKRSVSFFIFFFFNLLIQFLKGDKSENSSTLSSLCLKEKETEGCTMSLVDAYIPSIKETGYNSRNSLVFLFTKSNEENPEFLHECGGRLPNNTVFDPKCKTEIIIHGWLDGVCRTAWMREMKDELMTRGCYNVILIDWTWGNGPDYYTGAANTRIVGEQTAFVIKNIMEQTGISSESVHIIGHSFGSHIAGFAGQKISNLWRITALDPALAPFHNVPTDERLDPTDAILVDAIHSNAGTCFGAVFGEINSLGHADFYPNGGSVQISCIPYILISYLKLDIFYATLTLLPNFCNHLQSLQYYKASINADDCQFIGVKCKSYERFKEGKCNFCKKNRNNYAVMGMDFDKYFLKTNSSSSSKYYLDTTLLCPYCEKTKLTAEIFN